MASVSAAAASTPTLVFIPGAWHQATCYDKIISLLERIHSLRCVRVTLPSTQNNPLATFKDDLDAARAAVMAEMNHGRDVIVIAHSYGGMVGCSVIKGLAKPKVVSVLSAEQEGEAPSEQVTTAAGVSALVLIASGFALTGVSFMAPFLNHPPPSWRINKETGFAEIQVDPHQFFYHDVEKEESDKHVAKLTNQSLKALFEGGEHVYSGWKHVPSWYIGTIQDQGLPVFAQRLNIGMARAMGGVVTHRELNTSHSPFLSQPEQVVEIIVEAVNTVSARSADEKAKADAVVKLDSKIVIPYVSLFSPLSWFRYGLPYSMGRLVGYGIRAFRREPIKKD